MASRQRALAARLTSGAPVAPLTWTKFLKDLSADFLLSLPPALLGVGVLAIPQDTKTLVVAVFTIGTAAVKALYRAWLRWATS